MMPSGMDANEGLRNKLCWGGGLRNSYAGCTPSFYGGINHFKNKFCANCSANGFRLMAHRVRALPQVLPAELERVLAHGNSHAGGFWKMYHGGIGRFRIINNTLHCTGPVLVVFEHPPPESSRWLPVPKEWLDEAGQLPLRVAKGTLVPNPPRAAKCRQTRRKAQQVDPTAMAAMHSGYTPSELDGMAAMFSFGLGGENYSEEDLGFEQGGQAEDGSFPTCMPVNASELPGEDEEAAQQANNAAHDGASGKRRSPSAPLGVAWNGDCGKFGRRARRKVDSPHPALGAVSNGSAINGASDLSAVMVESIPPQHLLRRLTETKSYTCILLDRMLNELQLTEEQRRLLETAHMQVCSVKY